ncbi:cardiolipin synthase [Vitreoscilla massiliensis]|uniref:cardiolipin synthase n=1 Tax=Vitreoscilla massiliensis TaxID=1689272 RepID=UPI000B084F9A|nr:cardiolipin synthase [Vitreoscilla massiliensis]
MSPITTSETLVLVHTVLTLSCALRVLYHQKNHGVALAWLGILFVAPLIGLIAYLIIGEPKLGRTRERRKQEIVNFYNEFTAPNFRNVPSDVGLSDKWQSLAVLAHHSTGFQALSGHQCQFLNDTDAMIAAMIDDIERAERAVVLMFYIIDVKGEVENLFLALEQAAQRGVRCEILADSVGSAQFFSTPWCERLKKQGVLIHQSLSIGLIKAILVRSDLRNHRKLLVVDEHIAYTGSYNLVDPKVFKQGAGVGQWVDVMLRVQGPVVIQLLAMFYADVAVENRQNFADIQALWRERWPYVESVGLQAASACSVLQTIPSSPDQNHYVFYDTLICALHQAQREIVLTTPYFVPDEALMLALTATARRGVSVTLIVPQKVDSFLVRYASQASYRLLLQSEVKIALFTGGLLHTKSVVVDGEFALFGTVNMDMRSFYLNLELTMALYSKAEIHALSLQQQAYLRDCIYIDATRWQQRSVWRTLLENTVRLMSPLL